MTSGPRRLAHLGRVFFASCSVVALGTFLLWVFAADAVHALDRYVVARHTAPWSEQFDEAKALLATDPDAAIRRLDSLLHRLREVRKGDRLEPIKRSALETITALLRKRGQSEAGFAWADEWVRFDDRDLNAQLARVQLLGMLEGRGDEASEAFRNLYEKVREVPMISHAYVEDRLAKGDRDAAIRAVLESLVPYDLTVRRDWQVFLRGGGSAKEASFAVTPTIDGDRSLALRFSVDAGITIVRIDPPTDVDLLLTNLRLVVRDGDLERRMVLGGLDLSPTQMTQDGDLLTTSMQPDPRFIVRLPEPVRSDATSLEFLCTIGRPLPKFFEELLASAESMDLETKLAAAGEAVLVDRLRLARVDAARRSGLSVGFDGGSGQRVPVDAAGDAAMFDASVPVSPNGSRLEVALPAIRGINVDIEVEFDAGGHVTLLPLEKLADLRRRGSVESRDVEWTPAGLLVIGGAPMLSLHLDERSAESSLVRLRGGIE